MRWRLQLLIALALWWAAAGTALADRRAALVIGNSDYQTVARLPNPVNDAQAIADMFRTSGFDVVELRRDLGATEMRRVVRDFSATAQTADVAVVYFAGHGMEINGDNYLIPTDARLERDIDVEDEAVSLERVLQMIEPARRLRLVIVDACRDNPFLKTMKRTIATRAVGRGLARVDPPTSDTLIAFAAKAGSTAIDGDGDHSPFTIALLKNLSIAGLDLRLAFGRVRDQVLEATGHRQEPFVYGSLGGDIVALVPPAPEPKPAAAAPPPADTIADERHDYDLAERVATRAAWESFLAIHRTGFFAELARGRLARLDEANTEPAAPPARPPGAEPSAAASPQDKPAPPAAGMSGVDKPGAGQAADRPGVGRTTTMAAATPEPPVGPPAVPPAAAPADAAPDIARQLQAELNRVGCGSETPDGMWEAGSRHALATFNKNAGTNFDVKVATLDALEAVRRHGGRVCPVVCGRGFRASGDDCVAITCRPGYAVGEGGGCERRRQGGEADRHDRRGRQRLGTRGPDDAAPDRPERRAGKPGPSGQKILCTDRGCQSVRSNCHIEYEFGRQTYESVVCR